MSSGSASAPPSSTAVLPSRLIVAPARGWTTSEIRSSAVSSLVALASTVCTAGSVTGRSAWTTTWIAVEPVPPKCCWASSRTATDSEPLLCQPAPDSAVVTCGAKTPSRPTTITHPARTVLKRLAVQSPRRPSGPDREGGAPVFGAWSTTVMESS